MRTRRQAFSLIELLVVIAIIAVMTGLVLPGLAGAREAARASECASNVRQLAIAATVYADDHRGFLPPGASNILQNRTRWHGSRDHPSSRFRPAGGSMTDYLGQGEIDGSGDVVASIRRCPTFAPTLRSLADAGAGFELANGGYGYNNVFVGVQRRKVATNVWTIATDRSGSSLARFSNPAATIGFADSAFAADQGIDGVIEYSFLEPRFWPDSPGSRADPSIHFRHTRAASVAWLDTHVSPEARTFSWSSGVFGVDSASVGIGFTGQADNNSLFDPE